MTLRNLSLGFCLFAMALLLAGCEHRSDTLVVSGRVELDDIRIGSKLSGRIEKVNYQEGDKLHAGDAIIELDHRELSAQLDQASATLAQAKARLDLLLAGTREEDIQQAEAVVAARQAELDMRQKGFRPEEVKQAEAQLVSAASDLELAKKDYDSAVALQAKGTIEPRELDRRRTAFQTARAQAASAEQRAALYRSGSRPEEVKMAQAQLQQAQAELNKLKKGARPEEIAAERASVDAARANMERLAAQLAETKILAPADTVVETLDLQPGDLVRASEPIAVLDLRSRPYIRCYVPENQLGFVRPGAEVDVKIDSYPDQTFRGKIRRVNTEAEFTPRNVQTTEKRSELVFEMKVDITDRGEALRPGMYADVVIAKQK